MTLPSREGASQLFYSTASLTLTWHRRVFTRWRWRLFCPALKRVALTIPPPPIPHPHLLVSGPFSLLHVTSVLHTNVLHFLLLMWVWIVVSSQGTRKIWFLRCSKSYSLRQCRNPFAGAITKYPRLGIKKEVYEAYVVLGLASTRTLH